MMEKQICSGDSRRQNVCRDAQEEFSFVVHLILFFNSRCAELFVASVGSE